MEYELFLYCNWIIVILFLYIFSWVKKNMFYYFQLEQSQESDFYKVYEIDLHGAEITEIPDLEKVIYKLSLMNG